VTGNRRRLAIVIGSGGLKCAAAIGVKQVLEEENIKVDLVVGCSGGAVFGAAIALGFSSDEMSTTRAQTWTRDVTRRLDWSSVLRILFPRLLGFDNSIGIFDDTVMANNIARAFGPATNLEDTRIPFFCVGTDIDTGHPVVMSRGNLAKAVRISSGVPIVFRPLEWEGRSLIDGGASNPLPVDVAIREGADVILALGFEKPLPPDLSTVGRQVQQMTGIQINQLLRKQFAFHNLAHHSEIIPILPEFRDGIKINDVDSVPYIVAQGRGEARRQVAHLRRVLGLTGPEKQKEVLE
jgi:NTE family protein